MSECRLILGEALETLRGMEPGSVDCVVTDPPYFLPAMHYQTRKTFARSLSDLSILEHFFRDVFGELARVTKETATYYVFCDGQSYPAFFVCAYPTVRRLVPLVWDKGTSINGYSWRHQHELILFGERPNAPSVPTGDGDVLRCRAVPVDDRQHPAEKPVSLLRKLIAKSAPEGGTVLDPFMGSAATGVACVQTLRQFIGVESDPQYHALAERRIAEARGVGTLFAPASAEPPPLFPESDA